MDRFITVVKAVDKGLHLSGKWRFYGVLQAISGHNNPVLVLRDGFGTWQ